ncbi:recombinase family protein [Rhodopseudomonas sp.]|uniref:recombinase family protein n=1 Tax=Rhodopseudomonas sp. TaxID=1078 RepID=UPI003B3B6722
MKHLKEQFLSTTKAIIYCRVSDEEQVKKGHGLKSQEATCREFAKYRGYEVVEVFHENLSGKYSERPVMSELLAYLRRHKRSGGLVIIVDDLSRLARGHRAHWMLRDQIKEAGGVLESPNARFGDDADPHSLKACWLPWLSISVRKALNKRAAACVGVFLTGTGLSTFAEAIGMSIGPAKARFSFVTNRKHRSFRKRLKDLQVAVFRRALKFAASWKLILALRA